MSYKPPNYTDLSPYLMVPDVEAAIAFLAQAIGGEKLRLMPGSDGSVTHGEARIGDSVIMLGKAPGQSPSHVHLYVPNPDALLAQALDAGGTLVQEMQEQGDGDRRGAFAAPDGNVWWLSTNVAAGSVVRPD